MSAPDWSCPSYVYLPCSTWLFPPRGEMFALPVPDSSCPCIMCNYLNMHVMSKVKAELESQAEAVAAAYSKVEQADDQNKASLARAKLVEGEVKPRCHFFFMMCRLKRLGLRIRPLTQVFLNPFGMEWEGCLVAVTACRHSVVWSQVDDQRNERRSQL